MGVDTFFTTTPLFQINFFPDLMHVYFRLETTRVLPTLLHLVPVILADNAVVDERIIAAHKEVTGNTRLMSTLTSLDYLGIA